MRHQLSIEELKNKTSVLDLFPMFCFAKNTGPFGLVAINEFSGVELFQIVLARLASTSLILATNIYVTRSAFQRFSWRVS